MKEQLYNDFKTLLLPKVAEGLTITKEYFLDLFGRYVKYLIVTDSLAIILCTLLIVIPVYITWKKREWIIEKTHGEALFLLLFSLIIPFGFLCLNISNLIKDIYIPEVRIYEKLHNSIN